MKYLITFLILVAACRTHAQNPIGANDALMIAAKNRTALRAARLLVEQARADAKAKGAYAATTFGLGASSRNDVGATDGDLYISQPIDLFGKTWAGKRRGAAQVKRALASYRATAIDLQGEVLTAFAEAVAAQQRAAVEGDLIKIAEALFAATKRRFDVGNIAEIQVTRASIELERARQSAGLSAARHRAAVTKLAGILGADLDEAPVSADATIEPPIAPDVSTRPDLIALAAEVQLAEAEAGEAHASGRPDFNLQLVRSPWGVDRGFFVTRAQLTWPIFDHGRSRNESRAAQFRAEASRALLADATARAKKEVAVAQIELEADRIRVRSYDAILKSARDLVAKSQRGFAEGLGNQVDVLDATRALREVEQEVVEARQELNLAVIALYRATGYLAEVLK